MVRILIAASVAFLVGWTANGWRLNSAHNAEAAARTKAYLAEVAKVTGERDALTLKLSARDDDNLTKLKKAQDETTRLRDCVRTGTCGLRVRVSYPAPQSPDAPACTGVDTGTGSRLDGAAESAYFALRDGIDRAGTQLTACQDQLRLRTSP